jgi:hypothetical protein
MNQDSFTVVLNSTKYISRDNRSSISYGIDWSFIPEGKYSLSWKFTSKAVTTSKLLLLEANFGTSVNSYTAGANTYAQTNQYLGVITNSYAGNAGGLFKSDYSDNPPLYMASKPSNNIFTINIYDNDLVLYDITVDYVLVLNFKKIE